MGSCGSTTGDAEMCITAGATYRRSVLYKRYADGVQVPLDAADYDAELIMRRSLTYPTAMLTLTSTPAAGLTLVTEDDAVRVYIEIDASDTATLPTGKDFRYTLKLFLTADPDSDTTVLLNSTARVVDTAL